MSKTTVGFQIAVVLSGLVLSGNLAAQ